MTIPKRFRGVPWCEYIIPIGERGQYSDDKNLKVGDTGRVAMNVNLFEGDTKNVVWGRFKITRVISANFYEAIRIE